MNISTDTHIICKQLNYEVEYTFDDEGQFLFGFVYVRRERQNNFLADQLNETSKYFEINDDYKTFNCIQTAINSFVSQCELKIKVIEILQKHVSDMTQYSYYGTQMGIPQDDLCDVAQDIIIKLGISDE